MEKTNYLPPSGNFSATALWSTVSCVLRNRASAKSERKVRSWKADLPTVHNTAKFAIASIKPPVLVICSCKTLEKLEQTENQWTYTDTCKCTLLWPISISLFVDVVFSFVLLFLAFCCCLLRPFFTKITVRKVGLGDNLYGLLLSAFFLWFC